MRTLTPAHASESTATETNARRAICIEDPPPRPTTVTCAACGTISSRSRLCCSHCSRAATRCRLRSCARSRPSSRPRRATRSGGCRSTARQTCAISAAIGPATAARCAGACCTARTRSRISPTRTGAERERDPDRLPEGIRDVWQAIAGPGLDPGELRDRLLTGELSAEQAAGFLVAGNRAFVREFPGVYAQFLRDLGDPANLPTLFHCTAGKDRTGFAAALVLLALDVPREAAMRDYLLTNDFTRAKTQRLLWTIRFASLFRADPEDLRPLFEARESYLSTAFAAIDETVGGIDAYLRDALGVDDALRARLRANLLE
ncbi:MAG: tyrosine-protein phosphatase [Deltaproteobacteria bacterium]|nr:MAG: tyrosine-protein phosphatase [Deltaproteobacteria bacterium]